ncbi:MAG: peroxidase family protein [Shimia sp.]
MSTRCPFLAQMEQQARLTEANYADGIAAPVTGADPDAVAATVFDQDGDMPNSAGLSTMWTTWGQFLDHDLVLTPENEDLPLVIDGHDTGTHRSEAFDGTGIDSQKEVGNAVTWQIDGSQVYGSSARRIDELRAYEGGKLKMSDDPTSTHGLLPETDDDDIMAGETGGDDAVYMAGDVRANENPNLLSLHTMFAREHNAWAERIAEEHPDWSDEQIFDAARAIVEYELQKITYQEWLPHLLGADALPDEIAYDPDADGQMSVEFSTAAFRFGHTAVSSSLNRVNEDGTESDGGHLGLMDVFFDPEAVKTEGIDTLVRGQTSQFAQEVDAKVIDDLNGALTAPDGTGAFSLPSLNISRGADHGLPSYVDAREAILGDIVAADLDPTDFSIITSDPATQAELAAVYPTVHDVDMWVGGLAEDKLPDTQSGPLFNAIIVDQFNRTAAADETFQALPAELGDTLLAEIEATSTFSDVILRTTHIDTIQDDPFLMTARALSIVDLDDGTGADDDMDLAAISFEGDLRTFSGTDAITLTGGTDIDGRLKMGWHEDSLRMSSGEVDGIHMGRGAFADLTDLSGTARVEGNVNLYGGDDVVRMEDMALVDGAVRAGAGDDLVALSGKAEVTGVIDLDAGNDTVSLGSQTQVGMVAMGAGDDVALIEIGADVGAITGGLGFDTIEITAGRFAIQFDETDPEGGSGQIVFLDGAGLPNGKSIAFEGIEQITDTTEDEHILGDAYRNFLAGLEGDDSLEGGADDDFLTGDAGDDLLDGGHHQDTIYGGDGEDTLIGGDGHDLLRGNKNDDSIEGGRGDDTIFGGRGSDTIDGGRGGDLIDGGNWHDDIRGGRGDDTLIGGRGNDTLDGGAMDDDLRGGEGRDILDGGAGDDTLAGGAGNDVFTFDVNDVGDNRITDFEDGDTVQISGLSEGEIVSLLSGEGDGNDVRLVSNMRDDWSVQIDDGDEDFDEDDLET